MIYKLVVFLWYKTKLKARRRYFIFEKLLRSFKWGGFLRDNVQVITAALKLIVSIVSAFAVNKGLEKIEINAHVSFIYWQIFYLSVFLVGFISGFKVRSRILFPEDMSLVNLLPLTKRQLLVLVSAEHIAETIMKILLVIIIPFTIPLTLATREYIVPEIVVLITFIAFFFSVLLGFIVSLIIRNIKYYMLQRGALWRAWLYQASVALAVSMIFYCFARYFFADWLRQLPKDAFRNNDLNAIAQWINMEIEHLKAIWRIIVSFFQFPYWPYNLWTKMVHCPTLPVLGAVVGETLGLSLLLILLMNRYKGYLPTVRGNVINSSYVDKFIFGILSRLKGMTFCAQLLFRKNLLLTFRHPEVVQRGIDSLVGRAVLVWGGMGFFAGLGTAVKGTSFAVKWYTVMAITGTLYFLVTQQFSIFVSLRYLVSIDGEGRNIFLLRLAKVDLKDLYVSRVRLLQMISLPAMLLFILVLGVYSGFNLVQWFAALISATVVFFTAPKAFLLSAVVLPRFDAVHFEESGQFWEQRISDEAVLVSMAVVMSFALLMAILLLVGAISWQIFFAIIFGYYVVVFIGVTLLVNWLVSKLNSNFGRFELNI